MSQDTGTLASQAVGCSSPAAVSWSSGGPCCAGPVHAQCLGGEADWSMGDALVAGPLAELAALAETVALAEGGLSADHCHELDHLAFFD